jgi:ribonuclease P/MRP protein subunit RPP1
VQLSRITVAAEAVRAVSDLFVGNPILQSYDLVAVAPGDAEVLRHAVACGVADIIRLDMSGGRLPFPLKADLVHASLAAGCVFELEYAPAIRDPTCRRFFIANAAELLRLTRGNGILLTSGAANALELRSPADAAAIGGLAGISTRQCALAMTAAAALAIRHAEKRLTGALAGAAGAVLPRGKPTGSTHGAAHAAAASLGGALLHVGAAPVSLPRGLPEAAAEREEDEAAEAADGAAAPATGAGAAAAAKKPRLVAGAARGASGDDDEGLGADDDGNLMLLGAGATRDVAEEEGEDDGGASAAIAALAGAGLNRDRRKPRQQSGSKKGSSQGKQDRRQRLVATSQRQLLAVESSLAREPAAAGAGSKGAGGDSTGGTKARPWLCSAGARGLVVAAAPESETTKGKANGMRWAVPR